MNSALGLADSSTVMDPPSLSSLSLELQLIVFQSLASLSDVAALSRTSRLFNDIWMFNAASICGAILPRVIECFEDAQALTEAQAHDEKEDIVEQDKNRVALQQAKRYLSNQNTVHRTCDSFESEVLRKLESRIGKDTLVLTPTERPRFIHSYYQLWSHILSTSGKPWLELPLSVSTSSMLDLLQKSEMIVWIYHREFAGHPPIMPKTIGKSWQGDADMMRTHGRILNKAFFADIIMRPSEVLPLLYTVMDDFQDFLEPKLRTIASNGGGFFRLNGPP